MEQTEYCMAYECPLQEVSADMLHVCHELGDDCDTCPNCFG